jgi:hypothetical protein
MNNPTSFSAGTRRQLGTFASPIMVLFLALFSLLSLRYVALNKWLAQSALAPVRPAQKIQELPQVTLEEAQSLVSFRVPTLNELPVGLELGGAHVNPPNWVNIYYVPSALSTYAPDAGMGISIWQGKHVTEREIGGVEPQPDILVTGHPAEYRAGALVGSLTWEADGFTYLITYSGLDLSRAELQRIAESLR